MTLAPRTAAAICIVLAAAALFPTLRNGFTTWDDPQYILDNPLVKSLSPGSVLTIFTTPEYAGNYHPVTLLAIAVQYALFGLSPFGYHAVSLLLHLGVTLLVFRFWLSLTRTPLVAFSRRPPVRRPPSPRGAGGVALRPEGPALRDLLPRRGALVHPVPRDRRREAPVPARRSPSSSSPCSRKGSRSRSRSCSSSSTITARGRSGPGR